MSSLYHVILLYHLLTWFDVFLLIGVLVSAAWLSLAFSDHYIVESPYALVTYMGSLSVNVITTVMQVPHTFFEEFFSETGDYQKFVTLTTDGAIAPQDRLKVGRKEYKIKKAYVHSTTYSHLCYCYLFDVFFFSKKKTEEQILKKIRPLSGQ